MPTQQGPPKKTKPSRAADYLEVLTNLRKTIMGLFLPVRS
jgi:hypothetical protein